MHAVVVQTVRYGFNETTLFFLTMPPTFLYEIIYVTWYIPATYQSLTAIAFSISVTWLPCLYIKHLPAMPLGVRHHISISAGLMSAFYVKLVLVFKLVAFWVCLKSVFRNITVSVSFCSILILSDRYTICTDSTGEIAKLWPPNCCVQN